MGVREADLSALNTLINCPGFTLGDSSVNSQGLRTRPMAYVPRFGRRLLSNWDYSSRQTVPPFCHNGAWQFRALPFDLSTSSRVLFLPNTQTGTSLRPSSRGRATYILGQLVVRPGLSSGSSRANILAQVPVPKIRAGDRSGEVGFNPLPESHISGNRAGLPCRSGQTIRQESDGSPWWRDS